LVLQTGSTVVLARLISPEQYGLVGMVLALIGIGDALMNLGLSQATVQRRDVADRHVNFFFWLQVLVGGLLTAACALLSVPISRFYGHEELVSLTIVLGCAFLLNGAAAQHLAVLSRQMRFGALALIDVLGLAAGVVVAIGLAVMGAGVWALVALSLASPVCRLGLSWHASGWRPSAPRRVAGIGGMVRFGVNLTFTNILDYSAQNMDNVLIGRFFGAQTLGLYSRAYGLLLLPLRQIAAPLARVAVPVLSFLQDQPARYRRFFMTALSAVAYASLPLICLMSALSEQVISLMLGPAWAGAAPIFRILAIGGIFVFLRGGNGWLFVSTGQTGRQAVWALVNRPVIIAGFVVGLPWGVQGVAWGFTAANAVLFVPSFVVAVKGTPVQLSDVWLSGWRPGVIAGAVYVVSAVVGDRLAGPDWLVLLAGGVGAVAVGALAVSCWPAVRRDVRGLKEAFGLAKGRAGGEPAAVLAQGGAR
jgi:PST family polysaccharide transporter